MAPLPYSDDDDEEDDEEEEEDDDDAPAKKKRAKKFKVRLALVFSIVYGSMLSNHLQCTTATLVQDPNKPKRAMSSFFLYSQVHRTRVKEENPSAGFGDVVSKT